VYWLLVIGVLVIGVLVIGVLVGLAQKMLTSREFSVNSQGFVFCVRLRQILLFFSCWASELGDGLEIAFAEGFFIHVLLLRLRQILLQRQSSVDEL
jgi:hypothetical protein